MMFFSCLPLFLWLCQFSTVLAQQDGAPETVAEYKARMEGLFDQVLRNQDETHAIWIAVYDPLLEQDIFFALGNSTGEEPPTIPATIHDHFDIGSITKTFAGTIVLMLAEQGVLSLNDTVGDLVPEFASDFPYVANYTVDELLRMQTLVPDFEDDIDVLFQGDPSLRFTIPQIVNATMARFPTDTFIYSSTNFIILELIVDAITDSTMRQLVQDWILTPLGMEQTVYPALDGDGVRPSPAAIPYAGPTCVEEMHNRYGFPNVQVGDNIEDISQIIVNSGASGSMASNLADLLTWAKSGVGDDLLSDEMVALRHQNPTELLWGMILYGAARFVYNTTDALNGWHGHTGGTFGFTSTALMSDDLDGAVFVSAINTCGSSAVEMELQTIYTNDLKERLSSMTTAGDTMPPTTSIETDGLAPTATTPNANEPPPPTASGETSTEEGTSSSGHLRSFNTSVLVCFVVYLWSLH